MRTLSTIAAVVGLTSASIVSAAVQFTVTDLGGLGGTLGSRGSSVGSSVLVAGTSYLAGNGSVNAMTAAVGGGGSVTRVAYPGLSGGANSYGMGVGGSSGETLVGYAQFGRGAYHAISGTAGSTTDLHSTITAAAAFSGGAPSRALAINANDTIVGQASAGSALQAFSLSGGTATAIPFIGGGGYANSLAVPAVNDGGLAVGFDYNGTWNYSIGNSISGGVAHAQAFSWDGGTLTALGTLGGLDSIATGVNSAGVIVGQSTVAGTDLLDTKGHAFVYSGGTMAAVPELAGATMSLADDVNDNGDVVGTYRTAAFGGHAFLSHNGQTIDLNSQISGSGWVLIEATSINEDGYITGYGTHNGTPTAFLLAPVAGAPVPEPTSIGLLGVGAMALIGRRRRA